LCIGYAVHFILHYMIFLLNASAAPGLGRFWNSERAKYVLTAAVYVGAAGARQDSGLAACMMQSFVGLGEGSAGRGAKSENLRVKALHLDLGMFGFV
jgi:hypothetical protein